MQFGTEEPGEYQSKLNSSNTNTFYSDQARDWINWKKLLLYFILLNSAVPTSDQISDYEIKLREACNAGGSVSK